MPIEDRELAAGTRLVARYRGAEHACEVVRTDDGVRYRLEDGREFRTPSGAGRAVIGHACNGWAFWSLAGAGPPARAKTSKETVAKAAPRAKAKAAPKTPNGGRPKKGRARASGEGEPSFACGDCDATFPSLDEAQAHVAGVHGAP